MWFPTIVVLHESRVERLPEATIRINSPRHSEVERRRRARQEIRQACENHDAAQLTSRVLIELHALALATEAQTVSTLGPKQRIMPLVIIQVIVPREAVITHHLRHQSRNRQETELHAARRRRYPPKVWRHIHGALVVNLRCRPREAHPQRIQQSL